MMYYGTEMNALNFMVKRSKFKVTVEQHMLEASLHRRNAYIAYSTRRLVSSYFLLIAVVVLELSDACCAMLQQLHVFLLTSCCLLIAD